MSRGHGRIQRRLVELFTGDVAAALDTEELCRLVYDVAEVEKRHRAAVLRALRRLAVTTVPGLARRVLELEMRSDVWFDVSAHDGALPSTSAPAGAPRPRRMR